MDFLWLAEGGSEVGCSQGCKSDLLGHQVNSGHLSASPQVHHHLRFPPSTLRGPIRFQNQHPKWETSGVSDISGEGWFSLSTEQILKPLPWTDPPSAEWSWTYSGKDSISERRKSKSPLSWFHHLWMYDLKQVTLSLGQLFNRNFWHDDDILHLFSVVWLLSPWNVASVTEMLN